MPQLLFSVGALSEITTLPKVMSAKDILLVTGQSAVEHKSAYKDFKEKLLSAGHTIHSVKVSGEPSPELIDSSCQTYRDLPISVVIAIGGGSVLDAGKAISAMLPVNDSVKLYLEGIGTQKHSGSKVPFIAVPTTAGTGSEATSNAVLSQVGSGGYKRSLRHDAFVPDVAVLDPSLAISCPVQVTAASALDALTQLMEAYVSTKSSPLTDALALEGLHTLAHSLIPVCTTHGTDLSHRGNMAYAAYLSGIVLANAGLGLVHGFASPIGGLFGIPHGIVCGTLQGEVLKTNIDLLKKAGTLGELSLRKYADIGKILTGHRHKDDSQQCDDLVSYVEQLIQSLSIPKLSHYGLSIDDLSMIVSQTDCKNNPVHVSKDVLLEILIRRL